MVGFQTKLKYAEQVRIFKTIPGLENAEFARLGGLHRNTFLNSPRLLDDQLRFKSLPRLRFAGQVTGVEGYVESAAMGLMAGRMAAAQATGKHLPAPPATTAHGALINHITGGHIATTETRSSFQPMNINFGLMPPVEVPKQKMTHTEKGQSRKRAYTSRAMADFKAWLAAHG
jgi:methylenetetrahydrofolate--tRNA-(uracil-5-)-methyltransferase